MAHINKHMRTAKKGDYLSIQAYLPYTAEVAEALAKMRLILREKSGVPVTVGYGPRFLHSTGQLHKGGANNVVAVQLTYDPRRRSVDSGRAILAFATLIRAQALGDFESSANARAAGDSAASGRGAGFGLSQDFEGVEQCPGPRAQQGQAGAQAESCSRKQRRRRQSQPQKKLSLWRRRLRLNP